MNALNAHTTALLVIDLQVGVIDGSFDVDGVVERTVDLVTRAREAGAPVIWVQHDDEELERFGELWQLDPRLQPEPNEPRVFKTFSDSFSATELESVLNDLNVQTLVITGAQTDFCIRNTWHSALVRGFNTVLVIDAHTTFDSEFDGTALPAAEIIAYTNRYAAQGSFYPDAYGRALPASEIQFADAATSEFEPSA